MSTPRENPKTARKLRKAVQRAFRESQAAKGIKRRSHTTRPNRTSPYETVEEEKQARTEVTIEHARLIRAKLPTLLAELAKIADPRNQSMITHALTSLMVYGILMFVLQTGSRRKTNEKLTAPAMKRSLLEMFPDLQTIPHHDTLCRLLSTIDVEKIETAQVELVQSLIRDKKFADLLVEGCYPIALDGTQKLVRRQPLDSQHLEREVGGGESKSTQYYVYVLEANLVFPNGMTIPLMSEFLDYEKGDRERDKQDCEQKAFHRLAARLKEAFPRLPILLLLDGLFSVGPVMERCRSYQWHYMIVLKDKSLPQVWEEYRGLSRYITDEQRLSQIWDGRQQSFHWVNEIEYFYGENEKKHVTVHLAVCKESWKEVDEKARLVECSGKNVWLSDLSFDKKAVHERCNLGGRGRWGIEESIQEEKCRGYNYQHCYAFDWNAMRGYHYLMRIANILNELAAFCTHLVEAFKERGLEGFIEFVRTTLSGVWLELEELRDRLRRPFQLRLICTSLAPP